MFKVQGQGDEAHYVYLGVWPHDDAIAFARRAQSDGQPGQRHRRADPGGSRDAPQPTPSPARVGGRRSERRRACLAPRRPGASAEADLVDELGLDDGAGRAGPGRDARRTSSSTSPSDAVEWQGIGARRAGERRVGRRGEGVADARRTDEPTPTRPSTRTPDHRGAQAPGGADAVRLRRGRRGAATGDRGRATSPPGGSSCTRSSGGTPSQRYSAAPSGSPVAPAPARPWCCCTALGCCTAAIPTARIVLTTFTRTLAESMRRDLSRSTPTSCWPTSLGDPGVFVVGVDAAVSAASQDSGAGRAQGRRSERCSGQRTDRIQAATPSR